MLLRLIKSPVMQKTEELCQTILDQPSFKELKSKINAFMNDEVAKMEYQSLIYKQNELKLKQQQGMNLTSVEIAEFEQERDKMLENPTIKDFFAAQSEIHEIETTISKYISKTFDLERVPTEEDLHAGCGCGSNGGGCGTGGCGCH